MKSLLAAFGALVLTVVSGCHANAPDTEEEKLGSAEQSIAPQCAGGASQFLLPEGHPFLLFDSAKMAQLHVAASAQDAPQWAAAMKAATYTPIVDPYNPASKTTIVDKSNALARWLEQFTTAYILRNTVDQPSTGYKLRDILIDGWNDLNLALTSSTSECRDSTGAFKPEKSHVCTVAAGNAFFWSMVAFDAIYPQLSAIDRCELDAKLSEFATPHLTAVSDWHAATYGIRGLWYLFHRETSGNVANALDAINAYRSKLDELITADGAFVAGPGYAYQRFGGPRPIKARFMDVVENLRAYLTPRGLTAQFYKDPATRKFYEWLYGYSLSPNNQLYTFGDSGPVTLDKVDTYALRMFNYGEDAERLALRLPIDDGEYKNPLVSILLDRFDYEQHLLGNHTAGSLPEVLKSRSFPDGGVWLHGGTSRDAALSAALWNFTSVGNDPWNHTHADVNSINFTAGGERLFDNVGYFGSPTLGCNSPLPQGGTVACPCPVGVTDCGANGFDTNYIRLRPAANNTLFFRLGGSAALPYAARNFGGGIIDSYLDSNVVRFGTGQAGTSAETVESFDGPNNTHERTVALVAPEGAPSQLGYFLVYDKASRFRSDALSYQADVYWHPNSTQFSEEPAVRRYRYVIGARAANLFLVTPPSTPPTTPPSPAVDTATYGLRASGVEPPPMGHAPGEIFRTLRASYALANETTAGVARALTVVVPRDFPANVTPALFSGTGANGSKYNGMTITYPDGSVDTMLESNAKGSITLPGGISVTAESYWARMKGTALSAVMVRGATGLGIPINGVVTGFTSVNKPISYVMDTVTAGQLRRWSSDVTPPAQQLPSDSGAPQVVSTTPPNQAGGIKTDAKLVIQFSEPMNQAATQSAFQSSALGAVTMNWLSATQLEVSAALIYGPNQTAKSYSYTITTGATDVAGNHLAQAYSGSFSTARRFTTTLPFEKTLWQGQGATGVSASGNSSDCNTTMDNYVSYIGVPYGQLCRVLTGYSLSNIPAGATVESAKLSCSDSYDFGSPFPTFGPVRIDHIEYNTSNLAGGFGVARKSGLGAIFTSAPSEATVDVTSALNVARGSGRSAVQFRLQFADEPSNTAIPSKGARFYYNGAGGCRPLDVSYLLP